MKYKLFFPHISRETPNLIIDTDEDLYFYNGLAVIGKSESELWFIKKIMASRLFWFYLRCTSKPYSSDYISMSKNYIRRFGIYNFSDSDIEYIIKEDDATALNNFIEAKYAISLEKVTF